MGQVGRVGPLVATLTASVPLLHAQATSEVASVKPNRSGFPGGSTEVRPGQFIAGNQTLRVLILAAYGLESKTAPVDVLVIDAVARPTEM